MSFETALHQPANIGEHPIPPARTTFAMENAAAAPPGKLTAQTDRKPKHRIASAHTTLSAHGAPLVWLTGGALATALAMIIGLLALVLYHGLQTFWPLPLRQFQVLADNAGDSVTKTTFLGEV
ncbi:MAG TPA: hypothetical protein VGJ04_10610, partial [Pirellulales bacterium]